MRKMGNPERNEVVVCQVLKVHPNSVIAKLVEYDKTGLIHVSEVASKWVRDIRDFVKENQYIVCRVMKIDSNGIYLSIKRVPRSQASSKLNEYKRDTKSEKMLELIGKKMKKNLDQAYKTIGYDIVEAFGSLTKGFEIAAKNPDLFKSKGIKKEWIDAIIEIVNKNRAQKSYRVTADLIITCHKPDGVKVIKSALSKVKGDGIQISYVSAPKYSLVGTGSNYKEIENKVETIAESIVKDIIKTGGRASFKIED
ncbi:MAG: hypothetical protein ABIH52_03135 [Candidatus Aenigmatarchaeota archaeon]